MSAQEQGGRWQRMPDGEVAIKPTLMRWIDTANGYGYYEEFIPSPDARDAEIERLKDAYVQLDSIACDRFAEIATLKSQLAEAQADHARERDAMNESLLKMKSQLAEATKPVSVPGQAEADPDEDSPGLTWKSRALALERRVRELENPKHPPDATPERQGKIPVWFSYDDVGDTGILYVNIGAKIIALKEFGPFRSLKSVLSGEPARAEAVAKIKGGAQ